MFVIMACTAYAYRVNSQRADDDPQKQDFDLFAILLAPFTFPLLLVLGIFIFILKALLFTLVLVLFMLALIGARDPFILRWLGRMAVAFGNRLLAINTMLIKLFWKPKAAGSGTANSPARPASPSPYSLDSLARRFV